MREIEWRHPTLDDVPVWGSMLRACEAVDQTGENMSDDEVRDLFEAPNLDSQNAWFALVDGELAGSGWAYGQEQVNDLHRVIIEGNVHPSWRRKGIGSALLARLEEHGRNIHRSLHPQHDGVLEVDCVDSNEGQVALVEAAGYVPLRYWFEMRRSLADDVASAPALAGLDVRPYDAALDDDVRAAHNEAFLDHWGSSFRTEATWKAWSVGRSFRPDLSFVAVDDEEIAGYLLTKHYEADAEAKGYREGWIDTIGTRRAWRGRGVASALVAAALDAYRSAGFDVAALSVDAANPTGALGLYERLGFSPARTTISYAKPIE